MIQPSIPYSVPSVPTGKPSRKRWLVWLRRIVVITGCVIGLSSLVLMLLAYIFRDEIQKEVVAQISRRLNADVEIRGGIGLSFLRSFPYVSVDLNDVSILLTEAAAKEINAPQRRILEAERLSFKLNFLSFFSKHYKIQRIELVQPKIFVYRSESGVWNWEMPLKPFARSDPNAAPTDSVALQFDLDQLRLTDAQIQYDDRPTGLYASATNLDLKFASQFSQDQFRLSIDADADVQEIRQRKLAYLRNKPIAIRTVLDVNTLQGTYTFQPSYAQVADLRLHVSGKLADKPSGLDVDVAFVSGDVDFQYLLTLLPGVVRPDLDDLKAEGQFRVDGSLKGLASAKSSPAIAIKFWVENAGAAVVPDMPRLNGLTAKGKLSYNPDQPEKALLQLDTIHGKLGTLPFAASVRYANFKDPNIDCRLRADLDLKVLQNLVPNGSQNLALWGRVQTDITAKGRLADFTARNFTATYAAGQLVCSNVSIQGDAIPLPVSKLNGKLRFTPGAIIVDQLTAQVGGADISASGKAMDYVPYIFGGNATLVCLLQLSSQYVDFNTFIAAAEKQTSETKGFANAQAKIKNQVQTQKGGKANQATKAQQAVSENNANNLPINILRNIKANVNVQIKSFKVYGVKGNDFGGKLFWEPGTLRLQDVKLNAFGGSAALQLMVKGRAISADVSVNQMDIHEAMLAMPQISEMVVVGPNIHGLVNFACKLSAELDAGFRLLPASVKAIGNVTVNDGKLLDFTPMARTALFIKLHQYQNLLFSKLQASFVIRDSRLYIDEMNAAANDLTLSAQGSHGFDNTLDYHVRFVLPNIKLMKTKPDMSAGWVEETANTKGISILVHISGTVENPIFKLDKAAIKDKIKQDLQQEKKEIEATVAKETEIMFGKQDTTKVQDMIDEIQTGPDQPAIIDKAKNWIKDKLKPKTKGKAAPNSKSN